MDTRFPFKIKIHIDNMASSMQRELYREIKAVREWTKDDHFLSAVFFRGLNVSHLDDYRLYKMICESKIIEFHTLMESRRVLVRHMETGVCFSLDLDHREIITAYHNEISNNHRYLRASEYMLLKNQVRKL